MTNAATTHDVSSEAIADRLISARAVIADLTHHPEAAQVIAEHTPMPTERGEAEELIFWMEGTNQ